MVRRLSRNLRGRRASRRRLRPTKRNGILAFPRLLSALVAPLLAIPALAGDAGHALPRLAGVEVAGYAWGVSAPGRVLSVEAQGAAELSADGRVIRPLTPETPVRIASISKLALALALHRLADAGRIDLDAEASRYLGWSLRNPQHPQVPITVRQLIRHESSLSDAGGYAMQLGEDLKGRIGPDSFSPAAPGTSFDYANLNSVVLGTIVESVTGQRFDQAMRALVFDPLGLSACYNWSACGPGHAQAGAALYRKSPDSGDTWAPKGPWVAQVDAERPAGGCPVRTGGGPCALDSYVPGANGGLFAPQGGLRISLLELIRLGEALIAQDDFLKPATRASLFRARPVKPPGKGEETDVRLMQAWSEGGLHCFSGQGERGGDQPAAPAPMAGCGHLGEAYGLFSALVIDPASGTVRAWFLSGSADKPPPGAHSRFNAMEEELAQKALAANFTRNRD
jgi:CubicO group peptidase (beta-lactamase class C family)